MHDVVVVDQCDSDVGQFRCGHRMVLSLRATRPRLTVFTAQLPTAELPAPMSAWRWPAPTPGPRRTRPAPESPSSRPLPDRRRGGVAVGDNTDLKLRSHGDHDPGMLPGSSDRQCRDREKTASNLPVDRGQIWWYLHHHRYPVPLPQRGQILNLACQRVKLQLPVRVQEQSAHPSGLDRRPRAHPFGIGGDRSLREGPQQRHRGFFERGIAAPIIGLHAVRDLLAAISEDCASDSSAANRAVRRRSVAKNRRSSVLPIHWPAVPEQLEGPRVHLAADHRRRGGDHS